MDDLTKQLIIRALEPIAEGRGQRADLLASLVVMALQERGLDIVRHDPNERREREPWDELTRESWRRLRDALRSDRGEELSEDDVLEIGAAARGETP